MSERLRPLATVGSSTAHSARDRLRTDHSRGPARATIVLGPAAFLAGIGYIAGWVAGAVRGQTFPDYAEFAATLGLAGAGVGWVLGALVGISISDGNRKISRRGAPVLWVAAAAAIGAGIAIAAQEESMLWTRSCRRTSFPGSDSPPSRTA